MIRLKGIPISAGIGIGPADINQPEGNGGGLVKDVEAQQRLFDSALGLSVEQLVRMRDLAVGEEEKEILDAHLMLIEDPELIDGIKKRIAAGLPATRAVEDVTEGLATMFEELQDDYLRARAVDIRDIRNRLLHNLRGEAHIVMPQSIYVTEELFPTEVPALTGINGVVSQKGGSVSHAAILIRAAGIPAVFGVQDIGAVAPGATVIVDGYSGDVIVDPDQQTLDQYRQRLTQNRFLELEEAIRRLQGEKLLVKANISAVAESAEIVHLGCDGIGAVRTEFLFDGRDTEPSEDEQFEAYSSIVKNTEGLPVVIRTLDAGSDKPLPFIDTAHEPNPALGLRGIRISLAQPELFKTQLRAILRAAVFGPVTIMYPMITCPEEIIRANKLLEEARAELDEREIDAGKVSIGAMIEVPSAAIRAYEISEYADYLSIGSNDLTQYTLAVDRTNSSVAYLYNELDPSVLHLIRLTVEAGKTRGIPVCVCGEMASRPEALIELLKLGIREISISTAFMKDILAAIKHASSQA